MPKSAPQTCVQHHSVGTCPALRPLRSTHPSHNCPGRVLCACSESAGLARQPRPTASAGAESLSESALVQPADAHTMPSRQRRLRACACVAHRAQRLSARLSTRGVGGGSSDVCLRPKHAPGTRMYGTCPRPQACGWRQACAILKRSLWAALLSALASAPHMPSIHPMSVP